FERELSVLVARDRAGNTATYPVVETRHVNNICDTVISPAPIGLKDQKTAETLATETVSLLDGAGVFAVEMFMTADGEMLVNEIAPRVHNSGHLTIEGNRTSQFEQHIRAVTGLPLGSTERQSPSAMVNILYGPITKEGIKRALAVDGAHFHGYDKAPRPGSPRKIGHITVVAENAEIAEKQAIRARKELLNA
ncbi:MAG TPA: ATP-grasp domain-containing protein, partial [Candidatus Saccharimonadales bacterium]|nr:ATP-grasp domain-containing protein [Candidatus Saccharimonadales bacterium]